MYNARISKLQRLEVSPVWATLKRLDGEGEYVFLINPSVFSVSVATVVNTFTVLGQSKPNIKPQTQTTSFNLPLLLATPGNDRDFSDDIALLSTLSKLKTDMTLPRLSFTYGSFEEPLCVISAFSYSVLQWREGKPTSVTGGLTIVGFQDIDKPVLFKEDVIAKPRIALSTREQTRLAEIIRGLERREKWNDIRVEGEGITGINRVTKKREKIADFKDTIRIDSLVQSSVTPLPRPTP